MCIMEIAAENPGNARRRLPRAALLKPRVMDRWSRSSIVPVPNVVDLIRKMKHHFNFVAPLSLGPL